jgi:hypothetical protein
MRALSQELSADLERALRTKERSLVRKHDWVQCERREVAVMRNVFGFSVAAALMLALVACGGGGESASQPTRVAQETASPEGEQQTGSPAAEDVSGREEDLRRTAAEAFEAFIEGDNAKYYTFFASDFRERCPIEDFTSILDLASELLGDISEAEVVIDDIRFEGSRAFVDAHLDLQGTELNLGNGEEDGYPVYWILEDGRWRNTTDDPRPCELQP